MKKDKVALKDLKAAKKMLAGLRPVPVAEPDELSKADGIAFLADEIRAARAKGFTYEQVAEMLAKIGVSVTATTIKTYMSRLGKSKGTTTQADRGEPAAELFSPGSDQQVTATQAPVGENKEDSASLSSEVASSAAEDGEPPARGFGFPKR